MKNKNIDFILIVLLTITSGILFFKDINKAPDLILSGCSINSFFNCAGAQSSAISKIMNIPISLFGLLFSLFLLAVVTFTKEFKVYKSVTPLIYLNALASIFLMTYSIIELDSLCPYCFAYQLASISLGALLLVRKEHDVDTQILGFTSLGFGTVFTGILIFGALFTGQSEANKQKELISGILSKKTKVGEPLVDSKFWLIKSSEEFLSAPVRISVFSDFQCPACKMMADNFKDVLEPFKKKINLQYINYPLDSSCNDNMAIPMHPQACTMSKVFLCSPTEKTYQDLFDMQKWVSDYELEQYISKNNLGDCVNSSETLHELTNQIYQGSVVRIESTPTIIINGIKFEGVIKPEFLKMILEYYVK